MLDFDNLSLPKKMNYLNLPNTILHLNEIIESDHLRLSTWLRLMLLCTIQENGGRIVEAKKWSDRQWLNACGVTNAEVSVDSKLYHFEGEDLVVWNYPKQIEHDVKSKRESGRIYAAKRWNKVQASTTEPSTISDGEPNGSLITERYGSPNGSPIPEHDGSPNGSPITEDDGHPSQAPNAKGKVKEGKVKEGNKYSNTTKPLNAGAIEEIYWTYPKHVGKKSALKAIAKVLADQAINAETLLQKTKEFAAAVETWPAEKLEFRPDPASWFNGGRYDDDPSEWYRFSKKTRAHPLGGEIDPNFDSSQPNAHTGGIPLAN